MNATLNPPVRPAIRRIARLLLGATLLATIAALPSAKADPSPALTALADKGPALPVATAFSKDTSGKTEGPYVLTLTNTSRESLKLHVKIDESVLVHNRANTRKLPAHELAAGAEWKIDDLAAGDKITIHSKGFAPLELTVP